MDRIDAKLLLAVQKNNRLTSEELSDAVGLSPTACQRRLARLRDAGFIEADVAIINPEAVGRPILVLVMVTLAVASVETVDRFKAEIRSRPEILSGYYVTGAFDFLLTVSAVSMAGYEEFTREFFYGREDIDAYTSLVVMDRVKTGNNLPISTTNDTPARR
ncbi:Lrp/AsnC family transcriptional regulator [Pukyongiella litopenaei]|uniref:Lrp/AsnC family transcriptional regulator n=1 Tax=Pukyongiella litopenaei TaxID=2605946 RepID=A0A2S0MV71_9RHOB|nr:Lrp/AsnC family transcriptional regulator [Pukyongiella litopenaei]AVO39762.1 Lrp/AsnC family transcriptional regulator [Pukyongiella litopenaei]